jgi:negative regulator of sigma E activity
MLMLKNLILIASVSICVSSNAQPYTPLAACEQELEACAEGCSDLMKKAEALNYGIRAESNTRQAIINDQMDQIRHLENELSSAKAWYRDPFVVGTSASVLTLMLIGMVKWR